LNNTKTWQEMYGINLANVTREQKSLLEFTEQVIKARHEYHSPTELLSHVELIETKVNCLTNQPVNIKYPKTYRIRKERLNSDMKAYKQRIIADNLSDPSFFDFLPIWVAAHI
jgi:hypothetical protein